MRQISELLLLVLRPRLFQFFGHKKKIVGRRGFGLVLLHESRFQSLLYGKMAIKKRMRKITVLMSALRYAQRLRRSFPPVRDYFGSRHARTISWNVLKFLVIGLSP